MFSEMISPDANGGKPPKVDQWEPSAAEAIFKTTKRFIIAPISQIWNMNENNLDFFDISAKKCYNSDDMRNHICRYLNYFERYYDMDRELFSVIANMKWLMVYQQNYRKEHFIYDLKRYILSPSIVKKVERMVDDNYCLELNYNNINNPPLQYTNTDAKYFMIMSILMCFSIPLITHFAYLRRIPDIDEFILECYEGILYLFENVVDIYAKLRETSFTNVSKNEKMNAGIWDKQDIRGKDNVIHSVDSVENIILNLIPKYHFDQNMISLNWVSIQNNTKYKITDIGFGYSFISVSSAKKDEDSTSDYDKFESTLVKQSEGLYLQNKVNCSSTMDTLDQLFGPFDPKEIDFYRRELANERGNCLNSFQTQLIFNLFYKYFGDTTAVYANNVTGCLKLMLMAKKILQNQNMILLPYIVSGKADKIVGRKTVNKKEMMRIEASKYYPLVVQKYQNEKIIKQILSTIATLISSDFRIIDYHNPDIHGKKLEILPEIIIEEYLPYTLLI